jgi:hypothetical protein
MSSLLFGAPDAVVAPKANGTNGTHLDDSHSPGKQAVAGSSGGVSAAPKGVALIEVDAAGSGRT